MSEDVRCRSVSGRGPEVPSIVEGCGCRLIWPETLKFRAWGMCPITSLERRMCIFAMLGASTSVSISYSAFFSVYYALNPKRLSPKTMLNLLRSAEAV